MPIEKLIFFFIIYNTVILPHLYNVEILYLNMKFLVILEPQEEGGYTVYVPSLPGCISEGIQKKRL
ncbi:MAG: hypothetical protein DRN95_02545 [Candidatus Hydrothermarchaeota archaeon]|nr:MAG: hypothetical protein DRN95_02545 [Candidatus Hydrothermarchaeota archaeon]